MKRILLFALIGFAASSPNLQAENQTVVEGRSWNYFISGSRGSTTSNSYCYLAKGYHFQGTTTLDGKEYNIFRDDKGKEIAYMREEERKVYLYTRQGDDTFQLGYYVDTDRQEVMIYDFSCKEIDTFQSVGFDDMASHYGIPFEGKVVSTGEISYDGKDFFYQDINFSENKEDLKDSVCFIESLGSSLGLLPFPQFGNLTSGMTREYETLFSVTDADGTVIYMNTALSESEIRDIPANGNTNGIIYDLHGREVSSPVSGSIYIRDGKKFVAE